MSAKNMRRKKAITTNYAKSSHQVITPYRHRPIVRKGRATPLYRPVKTPSIAGSGAYNFQRAGRDLGNAVGYTLDRIFGSGDYQIKANSIMGGIYDPPELHNRSDRTVCIRHREYIGDVTASADFTLYSYSVNPGLFTTFPWLSQVAEAFEEYRFTGLVFEYKTLSADYTAADSAALGYVVMASQYNVLNPDFENKKQMENYEFSNDGKPSKSFLHPVECKRSLNPVSELFVRTGGVTSGDLRLYDHCKFQLATGGNNGTGIIGELWATFEIEFYKPKLIDSDGELQFTDHYYSLPANINNAAPLGIPILKANSNAGTVITGAGNNQIVFPANSMGSQYLISYQVTGGAVVSVAPLITSSNLDYVPAWKNGTATVVTNSGSTTSVLMHTMLIQIINNEQATFTYGLAGTLPTSPTSMDLYITKVNEDIDSLP